MFGAPHEIRDVPPPLVERSGGGPHSRSARASGLPARGPAGRPGERPRRPLGRAHQPPHNVWRGVLEGDRSAYLTHRLLAYHAPPAMASTATTTAARAAYGTEKPEPPAERLGEPGLPTGPSNGAPPGGIGRPLGPP